MACGRAIITTDAPGCKETVKDGENGFLVPVRDVHALSDRMLYFLKHPEIITVMSEKGRKIVEDKFDVVKVNNTVCDTMEI